MIVVTSVYNDNYLTMLEVLIESAYSAYNKEVSVKVLYNNISGDWVEYCTNTFKNIEFIPSDISNDLNDSHVTKLPSMKIELWNKALNTCKDMDRVLFIDSDTAIIKKIDSFFDHDFDIAFTYKTRIEENLNWPINTGVMLVNNSEKSRQFFEYWKNEINRILKDNVANELCEKEWGAVDQAVLGKYLDLKNIEDPLINIIKNDVSFKGFECQYLNETISIPMNDKIHIIHYKGSWHTVIKERKYNRYRSESDCSEMLSIWDDFNKSFNNRKREQYG